MSSATSSEATASGMKKMPKMVTVAYERRGVSAAIADDRLAKTSATMSPITIATGRLGSSTMRLSKGSAATSTRPRKRMSWGASTSTRIEASRPSRRAAA